MTNLNDPRLENLVERSESFYESHLKDLLEPDQKGQFLAIEPDTKSYFLGRTGTEAISKARQALPDKLFFLMRVGYEAAHSVGGVRWHKN